jgi:AcrR family transcriptional regulator
MATSAGKRAAGPRKGTATTAEGRATVSRILEVTREILTNPEAGELSMRNVASRAGLHLANVQYYFKTRDDLVHALIKDTGQQYQQAYEELLTHTPDNPVERFRAIVRFNLEDGFKAETRALFIEFWALMKALSAIYPLEPPEEISRRTTLIAALTEGLMVVRGAHSARTQEGKKLIDRAFQTAMTIAQGADQDSRLSGQIALGLPPGLD